MASNIEWDAYTLDESFFHPESTAPGKYQPLKVSMNVVVLALCDIDTATQSYKMHLELWLAWPLTKKDAITYIEALEKEKNGEEFSWTPSVYPRPTPWTISIEEIDQMRFPNGKTIQVYINNGKLIACECTLVTALYLESMEIESFPFDCQHLTFHIGIRSDCDVPMEVTKTGDIKCYDMGFAGGYYNFDGRAMSSLTLDESKCCFNVRNYLLSIDNWLFHGIEMEVENMPDDIPFMHCSIRISRHWYIFISRIFISMFFIDCVTPIALLFDGGLSGRLSYVGTMMLTVVAFNMVITDWLPQLSYMTLVDYYMMYCFVFIVVVGFQVTLTDHFKLSETEFELNMFYFDVIIVVCAHIFLAFKCYFLRKFEMQKMKMTRLDVEKLYEYRNMNKGPDQFLCHGGSSLCESKTYVQDDGKSRKIIVGSDRSEFKHGWLPLRDMLGQNVSKGQRVYSHRISSPVNVITENKEVKKNK